MDATLMASHGSSACKALSAVSALVWLGTCVDVHVIIVTGIVTKTLAANLANVRSQVVGDVGSLEVELKMFLPLKCLSTHLTSLLGVMLLDVVSDDIGMLDQNLAVFVLTGYGVRPVMILDVHVHVRFGDVLGTERTYLLGK